MNPDSVRFTIVLGLLAALPALSIDLSAPTLAMLPQVLHTTNLMAGLTLSLFMGGFALGQLSGGTLSDRHGRKPVLLLGFVIYSIAGAGCALSSSGPSLVACRFVQGLGAGMGAVLSFAIVQDLFEGAAARGKRAYVAVVVGAAPIIAPAIGSVIVDLAGWRAVHIVLAAGGAGLLAIVWLWLGESRRFHPAADQPARRRPERLWHDGRFVNLAVVNAFSYGAAFAYIAGSPVIVMDYYHGSSRVYAAVFACTAAAQTFGSWTGGRLGNRGVTANALLSVSLAASAAAALALTTVFVAGPAISGPAAIALMCVILFLRGMISPNLQHLAIDRQRHRAGVASAAVGVSQLLGGALSSVAVASMLSRHGPFAVSVPIAVSATAAALLWLATSGSGFGSGLRPWRSRPTG